MTTMSRRSSGRIAAKKSLATASAESLATANQDAFVAPNSGPSPSPRVQGRNKRKAVSVASPTGSHDKKLRRTITDTTEPEDAAINVSGAVALPVKGSPDKKLRTITNTTESEDAVINVSKAVAPPVNGSPDKKLRRTVADTTESEDAAINVSKAVALPVEGSSDKKLRSTVMDTTGSEDAAVDVSESVPPPAKGSPNKKLRRTITDTTESEDVAVDVSEATSLPVKGSPDKKLRWTITDTTESEDAAVDASEAAAPPAKNGLDPEPGKATERPITPSCQEHLEKPWVPPVIERRNPLVSRFEGLITPQNFDLLSDEQKAKLHTLLPGFDKEAGGSESGHPNGSLYPDILPSFWNDTRFRTQLSAIGERLEQGKYGQKFRDQIDSIMRRRADDEFRFMKDRAMESFWGQKKEIINPTLAGEAASIKLTTMARHHVIRINDTFCLRRQFVGYKLIEKHAIVTAIDQATGIMQLSYPPAQMRQSVASVEDKTMHGVHSPGQIERILLEENGTGPEKPPNGNSFKNITVLRGGDELGTLFFLRSQFFQAYLPSIEGAGPSAEGKSATSRSLRAPESSRLTRNTKSKSPLDKTHPNSEHIDKKMSEEEKEEVVEKPTTSSYSPTIEPLRSSPRHLSKIVKSASPVEETHPDDKQEDIKVPEEQKAPATRRRRATRKR